MKILHVAVFKPESSNVWQADGFTALGHHVYRFDYRKVATDLNSLDKRDDRLIEICNSYSPDIILFSKCNKMDVRVLRECNKVGTTALWYMDNYHNFDDELKEKIIEASYVFCSTRRSVAISKILRKDDKVFRITGGFNPQVHRPMGGERTMECCFIGSMHSNRNYFHREVGFKVIHGAYNNVHSQIVSRTKVNLNFTEGDGVSNRIYKIMGAGGFLLTMPWTELEEDFVVGEHLETFTTVEELKDKIKYYVLHDKEREKIAAAGRREAMKRDNVYYARRIIEECAR